MNAAIWLGFAAGFVSMAHRSGFGVLYPAMVADEGWSVAAVTGAFSVSMLIYSPAAVLTGQLVDRLGVRATMLIGTVLLGLGLALIGLAAELWQIYLLYGAAIGLGSSAVGFVPMLKLLSMRAGRRLGFAIGFFNVGQGIGSLIASPALQFTIEHGGWRLGFAALGGATLVGLAPLVLIGAPTRSENRALATAPPSGSGLRLWRRPAFWLFVGANASMGYLLLLPAHQVAHLAQVGLSPMWAATTGGLMGACTGLGALLFGLVVDRIGPGRLGLFGAGLMSLGVLALIATAAEPVWLVPVFIIAGGLGRGAISVNHAVSQARAFAGPSLGRVAGLVDLGFGVGSAAGPYLTARGRDLTGSYGPGLASSIVAGGLAALLTSIAVGAAKREKR